MRVLTPLLAAIVLAACPGEGEGDQPLPSGPQTSFDGRKAYEYVQAQLAFGPRVPGTEGHRRAGDWMVQRLQASADTVLVQSWTHTTVTGAPLPMRNIFARFNPAASERVLYLAHWDTRPIAEKETDPARRTMPIPGANDGASGVAMLLALADALKAKRPSMGVDILLVDGEDYGDFDVDKDVFIGSRYFAANLPSARYRPIFGVLWDMVGDADLQLYHEQNSVQAAPEVVARVWREAEELGYGRIFIQQARHSVNDDHIPLIQAGLRVIDVIDFDFPHHHTLRDNLSTVSAASLQVVGDVAMSLVTR